MGIDDKSADISVVVNITEVCHMLIRKSVIIIAMMLLFAGVGAGYSVMKREVPMYRTTIKLYITGIETTAPTVAGFSLGREVIGSYIQILHSRTVLEQVIANLGLNMGYRDLLSCISERTPEGTSMLEISVIFPDPEWAKIVTDELVAVSSERVLEIIGSNPPVIYDEAYVPKSPYNGQGNSFLKLSAFGAVGGAGLGVFIVLALYFLNPRFTTPDRIQDKLGLRTLAAIPGNDPSGKEEDPLGGGKDSSGGTDAVLRASAYRTFYSRLRLSDRESGVIAFVSSTQKERRWNVMLGLSEFVAGVGKKAICVDCCLYNPEWSGSAEQNGMGLNEYLAGGVPLGEVIRAGVDGEPDVIGCGQEAPNSCELLASPEFERLLEELKAEYDFVFLNAPPLAYVGDALIVSQKSDASVLVLSYIHSRVRQAREVKEQMAAQRERITGAVLCDMPMKRDGKYLLKYYGVYFGVFGDDADVKDKVSPKKPARKDKSRKEDEK